MSDDPGHITREQWAAIEVQQPEGFVLVPREPTEHMQIAGFESDAWDALGRAVLAKKGWPYSCRESAECVTGIFRAMLSAAPVAPECPTTPAAPESPCDASRVIEWAQSNPRPPASVAFTAGPERQAAYWIEWAQRQHAAYAAGSDRAAFEAWTESFYGGLSSAADTWDDARQTYNDFAHHMAWCLWRSLVPGHPQDGQEAACFDIEAMLTACVPGGSSCDPQQVADAIRGWVAKQPSQAIAEAHSEFPAPDLRGIDAATHHEWRMLGVPAKGMLIQEKDLPEIIKRACLTYVASNPQPKGMALSDEQIAAGVIENGCGLGSGQFPDVAFIKGAKWGAAQVQAPAPAHHAALIRRIEAYQRGESREITRILIDCIAAFQAPAPAPEVPDGYKLVPVEPTEDMLSNVDEEVGGHCHSCSKWSASWDDCRRVWEAMLAAAPVPAQQTQAPAVQAGKEQP